MICKISAHSRQFLLSSGFPSHPQTIPSSRPRPGTIAAPGAATRGLETNWSVQGYLVILNSATELGTITITSTVITPALHNTRTPSLCTFYTQLRKNYDCKQHVIDSHIVLILLFGRLKK